MQFYKITSYLTFPGIVLHETAHLVMCLLFGVKVTRVRFFRFDGSGGDVTYQSPQLIYKNFFYSFVSYGHRISCFICPFTQYFYNS